jgi:hypothetical protein
MSNEDIREQNLSFCHNQIVRMIWLSNLDDLHSDDITIDIAAWKHGRNRLSVLPWERKRNTWANDWIESASVEFVYNEKRINETTAGSKYPEIWNQECLFETLINALLAFCRICTNPEMLYKQNFWKTQEIYEKSMMGGSRWIFWIELFWSYPCDFLELISSCSPASISVCRSNDVIIWLKWIIVTD